MRAGVIFHHVSTKQNTFWSYVLGPGRCFNLRHVEEWTSVEVTSCRGSLQWIIEYVHNRSGAREVDECNTGKVGERELVLCSVYSEAQGET